VGSIVLTVVSLTFAVLFIRRQARIRFGFDVARAVVGVTAILVMAAVAGVTTPVGAVGGAIAAGLALGFLQGSSVQVASGERGFYARRSPLGIVLWGVGIVAMQAAGLAARSGMVRIGQTIAWFSVCLGVGLMVGRSGPLRDARRNLAGAGVAILLFLVVAAPLTAVLAGAGPAAAQTVQLTDDEVCDLIPAFEGIYQLGGYDPGVAMEAQGEANCHYHSTLDDYNVIRASVALFSTVEAAQEQFAVPFEDEYMPGGIGPGSAVDIGDGALHWDWDRPDEIVGVMNLSHTRVVVGPFFVIVSGNGPTVDTVGAAREIAAAIVGVLPEPVEPEPEPVEPEPEPVEPEPAPVEPEPGPVEPEPGPVEPEPEPIEPDAAPVPDAALVPEATTDTPLDADEPVTPEEAAGQAIAGLIAAAALGVITWAEAAGQVGSIPGGSTTTVYVTGAEAEAAIRGDPVGSHGVPVSVGPIVRGPGNQVSVAVEVDPYGEPPPPIDAEPAPTRGDPAQMPTPRIPPLGDTPSALDEAPPAPHGEEPEPPPPPSPEGQPPAGDEPEPPPPSGPSIEGGINRGFGDLGTVQLPRGTRPGDRAIDGSGVDLGTWVDLSGDGRVDSIETVGPDGTVVYVTDTDGDGVFDTIHGVEIGTGAGSAPDAGPPPIDEEPPPPALDEEPPPPIGEEPEPPPVDEEPPPGEVETSDAVPDVRLTDEEIDRIVRWGRSVNRPQEDIYADLAAENRAAGGSGRVEIPEWYHREYDDYLGASVDWANLHSERRDLHERIAELNRQAEHWTARQQMSDLRFFGGLRDVAQQQADYDAARAELIAERSRLEGVPGSGAEIEEVERQLEAIEEDHRLTMRSSGVVAEQERESARLQQLEEARRLQEARAEVAREQEEELALLRRQLQSMEQASDPSDPLYERGRLEMIERVRRDIESLEQFMADLAESRVPDEFGAGDVLDGVGDGREWQEVAEVEPAEGVDRGTWFDRPARELERIARERDQLLSEYRSIDAQIDDCRRIIDEYEGGADGR
jgi:hypothetical protein